MEAEIANMANGPARVDGMSRFGATQVCGCVVWVDHAAQAAQALG